jgi:phosphoribosylaminoimidazole-succinocarboxamide synthase
MEPKLIHQGKVRDVYAWGDELLLIATDRISAFDVVMPTFIPGKGIALTQLSKFWFEYFNNKVSHHVIRFELPVDIDRPEWRYRVTHCRKAQVIPLECVVRGYIAGSGWKDYQKTGKIQGMDLPRGLKESTRLPQAIFTPTTKAIHGHDQPLTESAAIDVVGAEVYEHVKKLSLEIYNEAHDYALNQGIIIADTKFEFGFINDEIILIDEMLTPDSSRFWPVDQYEPGRSQPSFDKQYVRDYLLGLKDWNQQPPGPPLPDEIVQNTILKYKEAYTRLTGQPFDFS